MSESPLWVLVFGAYLFAAGAYIFAWKFGIYILDLLGTKISNELEHRFLALEKRMTESESREQEQDK